MIRFYYWFMAINMAISVLALVLQIPPSLWRISWPWYQGMEALSAAAIFVLVAFIRHKHGDFIRNIQA